MKKIVLIMAALVLMFSLTACGGETSSSSTADVESVQASIVRPEGWPDNEYLNLLPATPDGLVVADSYERENGYSVMLSYSTMDQAKDYALSIKNSGFSLESSESGYEQLDMYMFTGKNTDGYVVEMIYSASTLAVTVKK